MGDLLHFPLVTTTTTTRWSDALGGWRKWLMAADRPKTTLKLRNYQLRRFAQDHRDPCTVTTAEIISWLSSSDWATETRRSYRAALRSFFGWMHAAGKINEDPSRLLPPIKPADARPRPVPELVLVDALAKADERTTLMILLAARQGLRRGEIAQVHSDDLLEDLTGWSLRVHGKGRKERIIPLAGDLAAAIRERAPGFVFPGGTEGHLAPYWVGRLVGRVLPDGWTTHTLRHRFATTTYHGSRDLLAVQSLLGHSKPETTRRYVLLPDDTLRDAIRWVA